MALLALALLILASCGDTGGLELVVGTCDAGSDAAPCDVDGGG